MSVLQSDVNTWTDTDALMGATAAAHMHTTHPQVAHRHTSLSSTHIATHNSLYTESFHGWQHLKASGALEVCAPDMSSRS